MVDLTKATFNVLTNISLEDLSFLILKGRNISHEEIIQFIKDLDVQTEDWGVTEELYKHFSKLHEVYLKEVKEDDDE